MSEYKIGDKVRIRTGIKLGDGAKEHASLVEEMMQYEGKEAVVRGFSPKGNVKLDIDGEEWSWPKSVLLHAARTWENLASGDILLDDDGDEHEVLAVTGKMIFVANSNGTLDDSDVAQYFKNMGWTIKQDSPADDTIELSVAEIETKLGVPAGKLRVKKD